MRGGPLPVLLVGWLALALATPAAAAGRPARRAAPVARRTAAARPRPRTLAEPRRLEPGRAAPPRPVSAPEMRAFERLVAGRAARQPLKGVRVLGIQHLLGSTGGLARALSRSGVAPEDVLFVGKAYSQNPAVVDELRRDGFGATFAEPVFRLGRAQLGFFQLGYSHNPDDYVALMLERELARRPDDGSKLLVIDDGGQLIRVLHERFAHLSHRFVAVEQTRKGIRELAKLDLAFPVIDVAQSWAKLAFESPMIGRSIGQATEQKLAKLRAHGVEPGRRVVLLGYGAVGRAAARHLTAKGYTLEVFDPDPAARERARADGARLLASRDEALARARILVSATGTTTVPRRDLDRLPDGAVLINAASGQHEIAPGSDEYDDPHLGSSPTTHLLTTTFRGRPFEIGDARDPVHQDTVLRTRGGKELLLVNDGYVVNFTGDADPIPPRYIQLTRGLLYLGALQAARATRPGVHALELAPQRKLVAAVEAELRARGESLTAPEF